MFDRRKTIIERHKEESPQWADALVTLNLLGAAGMSSDETDTEARGAQEPKRVRRVTLPWVNPAISQLCHAVDTYVDDPMGGFPGLNAQNKRGNKPLPRIYTATRTNTSRRPKLNLPRNFYNQAWWQQLKPYQQNAMCADEDRPIPHLVSINFHAFSFRSLEHPSRITSSQRLYRR